MDEFANLFSGWSWEENKLFEMALAVVDQDNPDRWEVVATMVGGKSPKEVEKHYGVLLEDLNSIESGKLDYRFGETWQCNQSMCWTDEDQKMLIHLNIN